MKERMIPSSRNNACPVCGRTHDGDCRIGEKIVFCHTNIEGTPGEERGEWRFVQTNEGDHGTGMWKHVSAWEEITKTEETFYTDRTEWKYLDVSGQHVLSYVREGSQKRSFTPLPGSPADYTDQVVLYRYHDAVNAINERREKGLNPFVFWVEGEKCAETLWGLGLPAVTTQGGWQNLRPVRDGGKIPEDVTIYLTPDRDRCGIQYVNNVAELYPKNPKKWVRCYPERPELWNGKCPAKKGLDVADWLAGVERAEAVEMLLAASSDEPIVLSQEPIQAASVDETEAKHEELKQFAVTVQGKPSELRQTLMYGRASELGTKLSRRQCEMYLKAGDRQARGVRASFSIAPRKLKVVPQRWLIEGILPKHQQTMLVAREKLGKTTLLLWFVFLAEAGVKTYLGKKVTQKRIKTYIVGTDQPETNWGEMLQRVGFTGEIGGEDHPIRYLSTMEEEIVLTPDSIEQLRDMIRADLQPGEEGLLIVDSFDACIRAIGYEEKDAAISDPLRQLVSAFEGMPVTQVILHHERKDAERGVDAFKALRGHGSIGSTVSSGIRLEAVNPESVDSSIAMRIKNRSSAEFSLLLERNYDSSFSCTGDASEALQARVIREKEESLVKAQKDALEFIRQATAYGEKVSAAELADAPGIVDPSLDGRARNDRARQIMKALEKQSLIVSDSFKNGQGRPTTVWSAREIPGVWNVGLVTLHPHSMSTMSTMSLSSHREVSDIVDINDIPRVSSETTHLAEFTQKTREEDIF